MAFEEIAKTVTQETKAAMQFKAPSHSISNVIKIGKKEYYATLDNV